MARTRLTSFCLPYLVPDLGQSTLVVGNRGLRGELGAKTVRSIELQEHGGVLVEFQQGDKGPLERWVFSTAGYGRIEPEPPPSKAKGKEAVQ